MSQIQIVKTEEQQAPNNNFTKLPNSILNSKETAIKPVENQELSSPQVNLIHIREKRVYKQFLKELKGKRAINGVIMADILGVSRQTIYKWLTTPKAVSILQDNITNITNKIIDDPDWKASAYILDKLYDNSKEEQKKGDLKQMIVINV